MKRRVLVLLTAMLAACSAGDGSGPRTDCPQNFVRTEPEPRAGVEAALVVFECDDTSPRAAAIVTYPMGAQGRRTAHTRVVTIHATQQAVDTGTVRLAETRAPRLSFNWTENSELEISYDPAATLVDPLPQTDTYAIRYSPPLAQ